MPAVAGTALAATARFLAGAVHEADGKRDRQTHTDSEADGEAGEGEAHADTDGGTGGDAARKGQRDGLCEFHVQILAQRDANRKRGASESPAPWQRHGVRHRQKQQHGERNGQGHAQMMITECPADAPANREAEGHGSGQFEE